MHISEFFYSIQGEGKNIGIPAVFLRLSGCNLGCAWCDTKYAQNTNSGGKMSLSEILKKIKKYPAKHLIITGGEPLIQQAEIMKLIKKLPDYYIEIETNGTIKSNLDNYINLYNCSPKLSNSRNRSGKKIILKKFPAKKTNYKFIVDKQNDIKEIKKFIRKYNLPKNNVILMPQGAKKEELEKKSLWLVEICKKENLRFSPRLHINLWGSKRKK